MALPIYSTGTVSVDAAGAVTVSGGLWSGGNVVEGDQIAVDGGAALLISGVTDATHGQIVGWTGGIVSGKPYVVYKTSSRRFDDVQIADDLQKQVAALNTEGYYVFVPSTLAEPDPSIGDDGQYARQPSSGKEWYKEGGVWTYQGIYGNYSASDAPWDAGTTYANNVLVPRGGKIWRSKQPNNLGHVPELSPDWWEVFLAGGDRYDLASFDTDRPASGETIVKLFPLGITFPAGLSDSQAGADAAATADAVFSIRKNDVEFATLTFAAGSAAGVFACAADASFVEGDVLKIVAPNPRDATLSGIAATLVGYR
jgi:hypothetical protein